MDHLKSKLSVSHILTINTLRYDTICHILNYRAVSSSVTPYFVVSIKRNLIIMGYD